MKFCTLNLFPISLSVAVRFRRILRRLNKTQNYVCIYIYNVYRYIAIHIFKEKKYKRCPWCSSSECIIIRTHADNWIHRVVQVCLFLRAGPSPRPPPIGYEHNGPRRSLLSRVNNSQHIIYKNTHTHSLVYEKIAIQRINTASGCTRAFTNVYRLFGSTRAQCKYYISTISAVYLIILRGLQPVAAGT